MITAHAFQAGAKAGEKCDFKSPLMCSGNVFEI